MARNNLDSKHENGIDELSEPSDNAILKVSDLTAGYGNSVIISDVAMHVDDEEIVTLIGPNGAGKSTVMKSIYGFTTIHDGAVEYDGKDITYLSPVESLKAGMSYILQASSIFPKMTVDENMLMGGFILNDDDKARALAEQMYEQFPRLADKRAQKANTMSGGERRLLELARGMILDPDMMLLDEPSIGLEPRYVEMVFDKVEELNSLGKTIMIIEQNAEKGLSVADRGYVLADGQMKYEGTGKQILNDEDVGKLYLGG